jgi:Protein of unknown function (DUF4232)
MTRPRLARPLLAVIFVAALGSLTACVPPLPSPLPGASSAAPSDASASPSPSAAAPAPAPPPSPDAVPCTRDQLTITYTATDNTAGHAHGILSFTNSHSTVPCTMTGYPNLYFDNPEAQQIMGAAASPDASVAPVAVTLAVGAHAHAAVTITQAGIVEGCTVVTAIAFLVAPPLTHPFNAETDVQHVVIGDTPACTQNTIGLLTVGAVIAG